MLALFMIITAQVCWLPSLLLENQVDGYLNTAGVLCRGGMKEQQPAHRSVHDLLIDLRSCSMKRDLHKGRRIHINAVESGNDSNLYVAAALITMYTKCYSVVEARRVFDNIQRPDVVSWTALILGYAENGGGHIALDLFSRMKTTHNCAPNSVTYLAVLKACTSLVNGDGSRKIDCLERGRKIHSEIGRHLSRFVQNTLIDMYANCGSMVESQSVFDSFHNPDVVSWNAIILGYTVNGEGHVALNLFFRMKTACGCVANSMTYVAALKACTALAVNEDDREKEYSLIRGREIHSEIGCHLNYFLQSTLMDMYANCGSMVEARLVFDRIKEPDVVSWNALIMGYANNGEGNVVLDLFFRMKALHRCAPSSVTYIAALKACGLVGALAMGRKFHSHLSEFTTQVVTCLVDFYAKCGSIVEAREVFDSHSTARNVSTWNALLAGYSSFGGTSYAFNLYEAMQEQGFRPDSITFLCLLSCCGHAGLVSKAREYFEAMRMQYGVTPTVKHYNCLVGILGRANQLREGIAVLQEMPYCPNAATWMALLGACHKWKNVEIGRWAFQCLVDIDKKYAPAYTLMAHIYGTSGKWEEQDKVLETVGSWKLAYATNEVRNMFSFSVGVEDPLEVKEKLKELLEVVKEHGYVAEVSTNVTLCGHSGRRMAS